MFIKKFVTKGIASGVGMATEAYADRKERKAGGRSPSPSPMQGQPKNFLVEERDGESSSDSEDEIELAWELDDAAAQLSGPPPSYEEIDSKDAGSIAETFLRTHAKPSLTVQQYKPLPYPVIVPQRRPKDKTRGFVRAYAPILAETSGIDQQTFLDFLNDFDKASKLSPVYDVINIACMAIGNINPIAMGVSIAVQFAAGTAKELQGRYKRNTFLDQINESLFKPRGLFCMMMTYDPEAPAIVDVDVTTSEQVALAKYASNPETEWQRKLRTIRFTSGKTKGEMGLPQAAPLVYPGIDAALDDPSAEKQNFLKSSGQFMSTYLDRKAQAEYAGRYGGSKLAAPESERQFKSKYADPNHPIHSGTIWGLVTAGKYDPVREKRARKARRRAMRTGYQLDEQDLENVKMGRRLAPEKTGRGRGPIGMVLKPVKKVLRKNVIYLTVVNLPSEQEMREIQQEIERAQSQS
jgi:hypothetical protein